MNTATRSPTVRHGLDWVLALCLLLVMAPAWAAQRPPTIAAAANLNFALTEIAGQFEHTRDKLRQLLIDLDHVDAAIHVFDLSICVGFLQVFLAGADHAPTRIARSGCKVEMYGRFGLRPGM